MQFIENTNEVDSAPSRLHAELGRIAYEAAADVTGCTQTWAEANQAKWIAAALAVTSNEESGAGMVLRMVRDELGLKDGENVISAVRRLRSNGQ